MVSIDHYAHELQAQLRAAAEQGVYSVVIHATALHRSVSKRHDLTDDCWLAMEDEMAVGDDVVAAGLSVRYFLPRMWMSQTRHPRKLDWRR
jgi:hypothetical protein